MDEQTTGAIMGYYDVALLAGHNVMHDSNSLKGDKLHKSFESHSRVFQNSSLNFLVLAEHDFIPNLQNLSSKRNRNKHIQYLFV